MKKNSALLLALVALVCTIFPSVLRAQMAHVNFGDNKSSTLTTKAWVAMGQKKYDEVLAYTTKCIDTYKAKALYQQKNLSSKFPTSDTSSWALNDVGACYYIRGKAYEELGKTKEALADYKFLVESLPLAECKDQKGFSWKPAKPARERMDALVGTSKGPQGGADGGNTTGEVPATTGTQAPQ